MSANSVLTIDPVDMRAFEQLLPHSPTLATHSDERQDVMVFHYDQYPMCEVPEYSNVQHSLPIVGLTSGSNIEARLDGGLHYEGWYRGGDVGVTPMGVSHWVVWDRPIDLTIVFLHPQFLDRVALEIVKGGQAALIPQHATGDTILAQLGLLLKADLEPGQNSGRLYRESIATALAIRLIKHHSSAHMNALSTAGTLSKQQLHILFSYIQAHLDRDIRLADLATQLNLSEYHLCRLFKQSTGLSPHQYLIQQRVERSKQLLKQPQLTITEIALGCGFANQSHFARCFRQHTGISPSQFRRSL
jgi:AraC family transcriptional regulator